MIDMLSGLVQALHQQGQLLLLLSERAKQSRLHLTAQSPSDDTMQALPVLSGAPHLFIRMKRTLEPNCSLVYTICSAMRSRKVLPSFTGRRDFAFSRPIDVPRPPLSFRTAVCSRRACHSTVLTSETSTSQLLLFHSVNMSCDRKCFGTPEGPFPSLTSRLRCEFVLMQSGSAFR